MNYDIEILQILENNSKISHEEVATMIGIDVETVKKTIDKLTEQGIILSYDTTINWEKTDVEIVQALIEVKVAPQRSNGFDKVAERIYKFPEVKDCYLMSGGFDLTVVVEGKNIKEVALFVSSKLAPIDCVIGTATHFVLKKYKNNGVIFEKKTKDEREAIFL